MEFETFINDHSIIDEQDFVNEKYLYNMDLVLDDLNAKAKIQSARTRSRTNSDDKAEIYSQNEPNYQRIPKFINYTNYFNKTYFKKTQKWKGIIEEISKDGFSAKLIDLNDPTTYEESDFFNEEISKGDLPLLKTGAIFYWSIGYANNKGQIEKREILRFKRSADFTDEDVTEISDNAENYFNTLNWEE